MSLKQTVGLAVAVMIAYVGGVVTGQTERFELEGNMKVFGAGNGIIFPDGSKQTSAGVGSSNDLICTGCVGAGEIAANAVGSAEVAPDSFTAADLATDSVGSAEIAAGAVGSAEIAAGAVDAAAIAAGAVGASEVANKSLRLTDLNATVLMNSTFDWFGSIVNGSCSSFIGVPAAGAAGDSYALVFGVRPAAGGANPGWVIEGEDSPTAAPNTIDVRVCNYTGANADPPNLRFNFWTIGQ